MAKFYGIGVGPGDPELLTIKASRILSQIDVVLLPQTKEGKKGVAYTIIEPYLKENLEHVYVNFPMVKDESIFIEAGKEAAKEVEKHIGLGKNVAFVTLGDPSVYSSYGYIIKALSKDMPIETIPGITSFCASAAMINQPLVEKDEILSIIPMNATDDKIGKVLEASDAFAFMKIYNRENRVLDHLNTHQIINNSVLIKRCGFEDSQIDPDIKENILKNKDYLSLVLSRKGCL
ncbi:precorrin-2/cobalt-factor-2 C20-methyltransferase [Natranaerovirga pectinivora]|uniref:Precorrin-2/cobalt-factor-2 C20-methyltransferase n=1 Tax=Natranaerovirga pectinivora TaxID=682400 RepID=A0A4R3MJD3_9FIRM|nr:precorrin-2 C(20)-methyltransferase [Natranaerovirga pectinivora]TCT13795.1 precorrin-2/cobalt-factor-2 C20-methyltransferase [Natranaerovirga pectinivora]